MLRLSNLSKVSSLLRGHLPSSHLAAQPFSNAKPEGEEQEEKAVEVSAEEVEAEVEGEEAGEGAQETQQKRVVDRKLRLKKFYANDKAGLEAAIAGYETLKKGPNYGPFVFMKKFEQTGEEENLQRLKRESFDTFDFTRDIKSKIGYLTTEIKGQNAADIHNIYTKIEDFINRGHSQGDYDIIYDRDFRTLISQKTFLPYIDTLLKKEFKEHNSHWLSEVELNNMLKSILVDEDLMPLLKFIPFIVPGRHDRGQVVSESYLNTAEEFLERFGRSNKFNYLQFVHHYFAVSKGAFLDQIDMNVFTEKLLNLFWGSSSVKSDKALFQSHLYDLLLIKLNVQENQTLKYFFADMFLTAPTYEDGLKILGNTILIINRLMNNSSEVNDLYFVFNQSLGEAKFNYYIKERLPSVLELARKKRQASLCRQTVKGFQAENLKYQAAIKPTVLDILDQNFHQRNSVIYHINDSNCALDFDAKFGFHRESKKEAKAITDEIVLLRQTVSSHHPAEFVKLFHSECQRESYSREIFQNVWREYSSIAASPEALPESQAYEFLDRLTFELEREFLSGNYLEKFGNRVIFNPKRLSQFPSGRDSRDRGDRGDRSDRGDRQPRVDATPSLAGSVPTKGFSTFIGANRRNNVVNALSFVSSRNFSNNADEKVKSSPFKDFLRKAEEVDQIVKTQQLAQDEVAQMKKTLLEKKKQKQGIQFAKIETPKSGKAESVAAEGAYIFAQDYWDKLIGARTEISQILQTIELHFLKLEDLTKAQNAIQNFVENEPLVEKGIKDHKIAFYKMFVQPYLKNIAAEQVAAHGVEFKAEELELATSDKLTLDFSTNYGDIEKDYNKYLTYNVFHFPIGEAGYRALLEMQQAQYKRRYFKRIIAHIARYESDISVKNLELIVSICSEQKIALTLIEVAELFMKNGIINRPEQFTVIIEKLRFFKDLADSSEHLARSFAKYTKRPFSIDLLGPHLDLLMQYGKNDKYMPVFDRMKEYLIHQKLAYDEKLTGEENMKRQEKFKAENKLILSQLYREFIQKLNTHKIYTFSRLLLKEQLELKLPMLEQDYINTIYINKDDPSEIQSILKVAKNSTEQKFAYQICNIVLDVVAEHPRKLKSLIYNIIDDFVYTYKLDLSSSFAQKLVFTLSRTADISNLPAFLEFLIKEGPLMKHSARLALLRLVNASDDEMLKPHILGQIERLFSKDNQEAIKERERTRKKKQALMREQREAGVEEVQLIGSDNKTTHSNDPIVAEQIREKTEAALQDADNAGAKSEVKQSKKDKKAAKKGKGQEAVEAVPAGTAQPEAAKTPKKAGGKKFALLGQTKQDKDNARKTKSGVRQRRFMNKIEDMIDIIEGREPQA